MCLVTFSLQQNPDFPLIVLANRDEFLSRPTRAAHWWEDAPQVLAGRDLQAGGTWMGVNKGGKMAFLTNYRSREAVIEDAPSRGDLVADFLKSDTNPAEYLAWLQDQGPRYSGFNLVFGQGTDLWYYSNQGGEAGKLGPDLYGLSNALLNTSWPKVEKAKHLLGNGVLSDPLGQKEQAFLGMRDRTLAPDEELPDTGVGKEWEKLLSPMYIESPAYGTRLSTLLLMDRKGSLWYEERSYNPETGQKSFQFQV